MRVSDTYAADDAQWAMDNGDNSGATSGGTHRIRVRIRNQWAARRGPLAELPPLTTAPTTT